MRVFCADGTIRYVAELFKRIETLEKQVEKIAAADMTDQVEQIVTKQLALEV